MRHILIATTIAASTAAVAIGAAQAAPRASAVTQKSGVVSHSATPKVCSKVSAASVAAIVGYAAPAEPAFSFTTRVPATKQSGGVSGVGTDCVYGKAGHSIILVIELTSKPLSISLLERVTTASAPAGEKVNFTPYSGLGVPGFHATIVNGGVDTDEVGGLSGNTEFAAATSSSLQSLPLSKLAALAKLARRL